MYDLEDMCIEEIEIESLLEAGLLGDEREVWETSGSKLMLRGYL